MQFSHNGLIIALDNGNGDISFISHAHSDHVNGVKRSKKHSIIASEETIALANLAGEFVPLMRGARLLNAGHILGSRQLLVEDEQSGKISVYTGDISLSDNIIVKGCEVPTECDKLVLDATYADPKYVFPSYDDVCSSISKWVNDNRNCNLVIGAYDLGKAQEVVKILNEYSKVVPLVTEKAARFCDVYKKFGVKLDWFEVGTDEAEKAMRDSFVAIVPMRKATRYFCRRLSEAFGRKTLCAVATGWALTHRFDTDTAFPLSDHADFNDLKRYVEESGVKELSFIQGEGNHLRSLVEKKLITTSATIV